MSTLGFGENVSAVVIGASGGIGAAFVDALAAMNDVSSVFALSRRGASFADPKVTCGSIDICDEASIAAAAQSVKSAAPRLVIVASGLLHDSEGLQPEKTWRQLDMDAMAKVFAANTFGPALVAKHFLPLMPRAGKSVFAALSARVGSISDNGIGGWYSYRASKAALNMMLRTASIEFSRKWKDGAVIGLHPGTVDTELSDPFQGNVASQKLFTPAHSAAQMLQVISSVSPQQSGQVFDYAGKSIPF